MFKKVVQIFFVGFIVFVMGCSFFTSSQSKDDDATDLVPDETCTADDATNAEGNCDDEAQDENKIKFH